MTGHHALVFGATGIQGWALTNQILRGYPDADTFARVTALSNNVLPAESTLWPQTGKLHIVTGPDLLSEERPALEKRMREIYDIASVSHVYFAAYTHSSDPEAEARLNTELLVRVVSVLERLSPALRFVVLPTGTKVYGTHLLTAFPFADQLPLKESHARIPEPHASANFYYRQADALRALAKGKQWTWCETRPDVIVGFVPGNSEYCFAEQFALYLTVFAELHGKGAECPWPGSAAAYRTRSNDSSQDTIARFAIYASLHPEACGGGQAFNVPDSAQPLSWAERWPVMCEYFGLQGVAPLAFQTESFSEFAQDHADTWSRIVRKHGLKENKVFGGVGTASVESTITTMDFDRYVDATKMLVTGFSQPENQSVKSAWWTAFDRFRQAKIIP